MDFSDELSKTIQAAGPEVSKKKKKGAKDGYENWVDLFHGIWEWKKAVFINLLYDVI